MTTLRRYWPVDPVRWIRARRGQSRAIQHVVAFEDDPLPGGYLTWSTATLCGQRIGDGTHWVGPYGGERQKQRGPKTQRPLVMVKPDPGYPTCQKCADALDRVLPLCRWQNTTKDAGPCLRLRLPALNGCGAHFTGAEEGPL